MLKLSLSCWRCKSRWDEHAPAIAKITTKCYVCGEPNHYVEAIPAAYGSSLKKAYIKNLFKSIERMKPEDDHEAVLESAERRIAQLIKLAA